MQSRQYPLVFLTTTLLVALTSRSSFAFNITPSQPGASVSYIPSDAYTVSGYKASVDLAPSSISKTPVGGTLIFLERLRYAFFGWIFNSATSDLNGSFEIKKYEIIVNQSQDFRVRIGGACNLFTVPVMAI